MGSPTSGKTHIYETVDGVTYARIEVSRDYKNNGTIFSMSLNETLNEMIKMIDIIKAAKNNIVLQEALDRVKIIYHLTNNNAP